MSKQTNSLKGLKSNKSDFYLKQMDRIFNYHGLNSSRHRLSKQSVETSTKINGSIVFIVSVKPIGDYNKVLERIYLNSYDFCSILPYFNFKPVQILGFLVAIHDEDKANIDFLMNQYPDVICNLIDKVDSKIKQAKDDGVKYVKDTGYITVNLQKAEVLSDLFRLSLI